MKKYVSVLLAVLMLLTLAACAGEKTPAGSAEPEGSLDDSAASSDADYSGVTAMPADEVEQFAALVKDAYLNEDWDWLAEHVPIPSPWTERSSPTPRR